MSQELITSDKFIEEQKIALSQYEGWGKAQEDLHLSHNLVINGIDDKEGFKRVDDLRKLFKGYKVKVNNRTKEFLEVAKKYTNAIKEEGTRLATPFADAEQKAIKVIDDYKLAVKDHEAALAKAAAELFKRRTDMLFEREFSFNGEMYIYESLSVSVERIQTATEEEWISIIEKADLEQQKALEAKAKAMEAKRKEEEEIKRAKEEAENAIREAEEAKAKAEKLMKEMEEAKAALEQAKAEQSIKERSKVVGNSPESSIVDSIPVKNPIGHIVNLDLPIRKPEESQTPKTGNPSSGLNAPFKQSKPEGSQTPKEKWESYEHPLKGDTMKIGYALGVKFMISRAKYILTTAKTKEEFKKAIDSLV